MSTIRLHDTWVSFQYDDWIVKGVQGEFYPCRPDVFAETYERVGATTGVVTVHTNEPPEQVRDAINRERMRKGHNR